MRIEKTKTRTGLAMDLVETEGYSSISLEPQQKHVSEPK
jgi:hypothetical protein